MMEAQDSISDQQATNYGCGLDLVLGEGFPLWHGAYHS